MDRNEFYIAYGVTNRVGDGTFYLTLDYDGVNSSAVADDVKALQRAFSLSDAWLYRTGSGFHAHFFNDNSLSAEAVGNILRASKAADPRFVESWGHFSAKGEGVTLRVAGKYRRRDVFYYDRIPGVREPSLFEKSVALSLEKAVNSSLDDPIVGFGEYLVREPSDKEEPKSAADVKTVEKLVGDGLLPDGATVEDAALFAAARAEAPAAVPQTDFRKDADGFRVDKKVLALKKSWYSGPLSEAVARVVSASGSGRELALTVPHELRKDKPAEFFDKRPFFLSNVPSKSMMLAPYEFAMEEGKAVEYPYNFFQTHAVLDVGKFGGKVSLYGNDAKELRASFKKDFSKYVKAFDVVFDLDSKDLDGNESYLEARKLRDLLMGMGIPFSLNFSGSKGFHVRVPAELVDEAAPELVRFLKAGEGDEHARIFFENLVEFAKSHGIKADEFAYAGRLRSLIRVQWSVHQATGSVVKPLTDEEFDSLAGKTLRQIRETYRADNVLNGNKALGTPKLNFLDRTLVLKARMPDGRELSWEEMRDAGIHEAEWKEFRDGQANPAAKELRNMSKEDPKAFAAVLEAGEYRGMSVTAPLYVDLLTGKNYDYRRKGDIRALREFVLSLIPDPGRYSGPSARKHEETVFEPPF